MEGTRYYCAGSDNTEVYVLSSDQTTKYVVRVIEGKLMCPCKGFEYSKKSPPTCRHTIIATEELKKRCTWNQDKDGGVPILVGEPARLRDPKHPYRCPMCGAVAKKIQEMPTEEM